LLLVLVLVGCGRAESTVVGSVNQDSWYTLPPTKIQARAGKLDGGRLQIAIDNQIVGEGPMKVGTVIPIRVDGHPCEVRETSWFETNDSVVREPPKSRTSRNTPPDIRQRTYRGMNLEVTCSDGPVPGTAASKKGANPKTAYPPTMAGLFVGLGVGALFEKDKIGFGLLTILFGIVLAVLLGVVLYQGLFAITLPAVFAGYGVIGAIAGTSAVRMGKPSIAFVSALSLVGSAAVLFAYRGAGWGEFAPLVAFAAGAGLAILGAIVWAVAQKD